ncbi:MULTISPECIES: BON domain-containing protein [Cellvibrio]|uniref:Osmotically-inducible protein OsmY n=1 Tax=Cellvibrio fibrivorans TaxID=126350 RepID=A0ABU1V3Y8_9GAMM|nr:BON domain-containing protein [Cellvibrio fibrivorans]MDR7092184.1 osmotically-inducible protein OsmY [Cellvibrio fibrivorans]
MKNSLHKLLTPAVAFSLIIMSSACFSATPSQEVVNARQETQIWTTYALSPYLRANDIKVSVDAGKATLTGTVEEDVNKDLATAIAKGVTGIKDVDNKIEVLADYKPAATGRGYGDHIDDLTITSTVKSKLLWSKYTDSQSIEVETNAGKVTLVGTADTEEAKALAGRLATGTHGVTSVDNKLVVNKTPGVTGMAKASTKEMSKTISDSWITTKLKSTYMYSRNVNGSDINVSTNAGVVTLSGKLDSGVERALAIELAQNIRGVKSVQSKELIN